MTELPLAANIDRNWARARIIGLEEQVAYYRGVCEEQALAIHVHEKGADEQAATERTLRRRIEELESSLDAAELARDVHWEMSKRIESGLVAANQQIAELQERLAAPAWVAL